MSKAVDDIIALYVDRKLKTVEPMKDMTEVVATNKSYDVAKHVDNSKPSPFLHNDTSIFNLAKEMTVFAGTAFTEDMILERYGITAQQFETIKQLPTYKAAVSDLKAKLERDEDGLAKALASTLWQDAITEIYPEIMDEGNHASKIQLLKHLSEVAGYKNTKNADGASGIRVTISFGSSQQLLQPSTVTVEHSGEVIEHEG